MHRGEIIAALPDLAVELQRRGVSADMYVVGGAAIALAFDERRATHDIDAVFEPKNVVYEAAAVVGEQRDLPAARLNDAVKGFLVGDDASAQPVLLLPGLGFLVACPPTLLALQVLALPAGAATGDV